MTVKKIDNGYVVEAYCGDGKDQAEYVKKLSKVPAILARWFGEKGKAPEEYDAMKREESEEADESGPGVKVKIKLTNS